MMYFYIFQIIQGAGHHVYADRAEEFNRLVNHIGDYVDKGELPPITKNLTAVIEDEDNSPADAWKKFTNVHKDRIRDEPRENRNDIEEID